MKKSFFYLTLIATMGLFCVACEKKEEIKPKANFSYEIKELTVTFTNNSKDGVSYSWDFGDQKTSTDKDPVHTYSDYGNFDVKLTVKSATGHTATKKETIVLSKPLVLVDGKFDEWANIPAEKLAVSTLDVETSDSTTLCLKEMKFCADNLFIYMYMKLDTIYGNAMDIYLNTDGNKDNGYNGWMWQNQHADYLMQGFKNEKYDMCLIAYDESKNGAWGWLSPNIVEPGNGLMTISEMKKVSETIVEFEARIIRQYIPNLGDEVQISIAHSGVLGDAWTTSGGLPTVTKTGDKNPGLIVKLK